MGWTIQKKEDARGTVVYINIDSIDDDISNMLDSYIAEICYGNDLFTNEDAKKYIKDYLSTDDTDRKKGAISEFFLHLFLKNEGYTQEFAFKNLEERSPKKGFDGVYKDETEELWFLESKSGDASSCCHLDKIEEAYRDLKNKFSGNVSNDPWMNAVNHVLVSTRDESLVRRFRDLSREFNNGISHNISQYNIMPSGSVVVTDGTKRPDDPSQIAEDVFRYFETRDKKGLYAICVTNECATQFEAYLDK